MSDTTRRRNRIKKRARALSRRIIARLKKDKSTRTLRNVIHELTFWHGLWGECQVNHLIQEGDNWEEAIKSFSPNLNTQIILATLVANELLKYVTRERMNFYLFDPRAR